MAGSVMLNAKVLIGGYNYSGIHNSVALEYGAEMLDETVFQDGVNTNTRKNKAGLKTFSFNGNVFWDDVLDLTQFSRVGGAREVMTFANIGETEGDICFITRGITYTYNPVSGEIGQLLQATLEGRNSNQELMRARTMKYAGTATVSATGNSTGLNLGSLATKKIAMAFHVFLPYPGTGGETIQATIESDDAGGFTTPTTQLTSAALTERGSDWQETTLGVGVTDAYWRAKWTIAGATPGPFAFAISFGWVL